MQCRTKNRRVYLRTLKMDTDTAATQKEFTIIAKTIRPDHHRRNILTGNVIRVCHPYFVVTTARTTLRTTAKAFSRARPLTVRGVVLCYCRFHPRCEDIRLCDLSSDGVVPILRYRNCRQYPNDRHYDHQLYKGKAFLFHTTILFLFGRTVNFSAFSTNLIQVQKVSAEISQMKK